MLSIQVDNKGILFLNGELACDHIPKLEQEQFKREVFNQLKCRIAHCEQGDFTDATVRSYDWPSMSSDGTRAATWGPTENDCLFIDLKTGECRKIDVVPCTANISWNNDSSAYAALAQEPTTAHLPTPLYYLSIHDCHGRYPALKIPLPPLENAQPTRVSLCWSDGDSNPYLALCVSSMYQENPLFDQYALLIYRIMLHNTDDHPRYELVTCDKSHTIVHKNSVVLSWIENELHVESCSDKKIGVMIKLFSPDTTGRELSTTPTTTNDLDTKKLSQEIYWRWPLEANKNDEKPARTSFNRQTQVMAAIDIKGDNFLWFGLPQFVPKHPESTASKNIDGWPQTIKCQLPDCEFDVLTGVRWVPDVLHDANHQLLVITGKDLLKPENPPMTAYLYRVRHQQGSSDIPELILIKKIEAAAIKISDDGVYIMYTNNVVDQNGAKEYHILSLMWLALLTETTAMELLSACACWNDRHDRHELADSLQKRCGFSDILLGRSSCSSSSSSSSYSSSSSSSGQDEKGAEAKSEETKEEKTVGRA